MTVESHVIPPLPSDSTDLERREEAFWNRDYLERIVLPVLRLTPGARVLDVGCGQGGLVFELARLYPGARYDATDLDEEGKLIPAARRRAEREGLEIEFRQDNALILSQYEDDTFDVVCCQTLLAHVPDAAKAIQQMARVLKEGGVFLAVEHWDPGVRALRNNVTTPTRGEDWHSKFFALFRLRNEGRKKLDDGDDQIGLHVPFLAREVGLRVLDVRLNDYIGFALDRTNEMEEGYLKFFEGFLQERFGGAKEIRPDKFILAADEIASDHASEYSQQYPNSRQDAHKLWAALQAKTYETVFAKFTFLTFAEKPRRDS